MKAILILSLAFILNSCTSNKVSKVPTYEVINAIWANSGTVKDIENEFGKPDVFDSQKLQYMFPDSKIPKMHFQFNEAGKLESALLFLDQSNLDEFKMFIGCQWIEKKEKKQTGDFIDIEYEGKCKNSPIRFRYFPSLNSYEVWWGKK